MSIIVTGKYVVIVFRFKMAHFLTSRVQNINIGNNNYM